MKENMISLLDIMSGMISSTITDDSGWKRFVTDTNIMTKKIKILPYKDAAGTKAEITFKLKDSIKISKCKKVIITIDIKNKKEKEYFENNYRIKELVYLPDGYFIDNAVIQAVKYYVSVEDGKYKIEMDGRSFCASLYFLYEFYNEMIDVNFDYRKYSKIIELFNKKNKNRYKFELVKKKKSYKLTKFDILNTLFFTWIRR